MTDTGLSSAVGASAITYEISNGVFRSYLATLEKLGWSDIVRFAVDSETRRLIDEPPSVGWMPAAHLENIFIALEKAKDAASVRLLNRHSTRDSVPFVRSSPIVQGIIRVFGPSPGSFFARFDKYTANTARGTTTTHVPISKNACTLIQTHEGRTKVPPICFIAMAGSFAGILDVFARPGSVSEPELIPNGKENSARFHIRWD